MNSKDMNFMNTTGYNLPFCGCFADPIVCLGTYCCIPCVVGLALAKTEKAEFDLVGCFCWGIGAYRLRRKVQEMFGIKESQDASTCAVGLCACCSVAQDVHELTSRGVFELLPSKPKTVQPEPVAPMNAESAPINAPQ